MKIIDKLKNALFEEVEVYEEVTEKPKRKPIKKEKPKKEIKKEEKPIAKKIVQPEYKEENETKKQHLEEIIEEDLEEIEQEIPEKKDFKFPMVSDSEFDTKEEIEIKEEKVEESPKDLYQGKKKKSRPYGISEIEIPKHEYGAYEKREERTHFKPSPIISPIYGILDKNYTKDEIVPKREIRLSSSYTKERLDVDDIRNKAFGSLEEDVEIENKLEYDYNYDYEEEKLVDLTSETDTPMVNKVTMGDAEEYFEDLGLEYNVDYKDSSTKKTSNESYDDEYEPQIIEEKKIEDEEIYNESVDEDNLFDLIDSMYDKE